MLRATNITGAVSEAMVAGYLHAAGYEVFLPAQGHGRADLVYGDGSKLFKVQVKTASFVPGSNSPHWYEQCRLVRRGINTPYTREEVDEIWIVGTHLWCFPIDMVDGLTSISLNSTNPAPRKSIRTYDPNQFIVVRGSLDRPYRDRLTHQEVN